VELAAAFEGSAGTFRNIPVSAAHSHFALTNLVWHLICRRSAEGSACLDHKWSMKTKDFHRIDSFIDVSVGTVVG
jgi:hypothetical protein